MHQNQVSRSPQRVGLLSTASMHVVDDRLTVRGFMEDLEKRYAFRLAVNPKVSRHEVWKGVFRANEQLRLSVGRWEEEKGGGR